jgi:hypothetical protein
MFWYVHLAFRVPGTFPLEYRTKPIFNAGWASEARATDPPPEANTKVVSEAAMNNDLNMKYPIFLVRSKPASCAAPTALCRHVTRAVAPTGTVYPKQSVVNVGFTAGRTTAPYGIPSLGRPRNNQWHISKSSGWYKSLYRSHRGPLRKKDDVQKTFHQGSLLPRFPD